MKIFIGSSSLVLFLLTIVLHIEYTTEAFFPDGKNRGHLDRLACRTFPVSKVTALRCHLRYIDRYHLKGDIFANLSEPINGLWVHSVIYYKYNTYQKIATEYWDDLCKWMDGKTHSLATSYIMSYLKAPLLKYTNFNHSCPLSGLIFAKSDNISVQELMIPQIMPAGRYRVDFNYTEGDRKTVLIAAQLYGTISDHRVEIV